MAVYSEELFARLRGKIRELRKRDEAELVEGRWSTFEKGRELVARVAAFNEIENEAITLTGGRHEDGAQDL